MSSGTATTAAAVAATGTAAAAGAERSPLQTKAAGDTNTIDATSSSTAVASSAPSPLLRVGVLGCTGLVGQRFLALLTHHPRFQVVAITASERSAGKKYREAVRWQLPSETHPMPSAMGAMVISPTTLSVLLTARCRLIFSALDATAAYDIELQCARHGMAVFSNASAHRMAERVPILVPHANPQHLHILAAQARDGPYEKTTPAVATAAADTAVSGSSAGATTTPTVGFFPSGGFLVTNGNCSTIGIAIALRPLQVRWGLKRVMVTTLQAISGAGYPGVSAMDITENCLPRIEGEEEKIEKELAKILGVISDHRGAERRKDEARGADSQQAMTTTSSGSDGDAAAAATSTSASSPSSSASSSAAVFLPAPLLVSATCNRVPVLDGHTACVSVELGTAGVTVEEVAAAMEEWRTEAQELRLHSAPEKPIFVHPSPDRPQPRLDRDRCGGFQVTVGRIRACPLLQFKFTLCSHNTILGAAGGSILNAELADAKGLL